MHFDPAEYASRQNAVRHEMARRGIDLLVISDPCNGSVANSDTVSKIGLMYCQGQLR
jgi:hypothetical protein